MQNETVANNAALKSTQDYLVAADRALLFVTRRPLVVMASGRGMYLTDTEGKEYLDFVGGWAVTCLGHSPEVIHKTLAGNSPQPSTVRLMPPLMLKRYT